MDPNAPTTAEENFLGLRSDGSRISIALKVGIPVRAPDSSSGAEEWTCPVSLDPLYPRLRDAHAGSSLQSLCLAISLVVDLLDKFQEDGGKLFYDDGTPYSLDVLAFGRVARARTAT